MKSRPNEKSFLSWKWAAMLSSIQWPPCSFLLWKRKSWHRHCCCCCARQNLFNIRLFNGCARLRHPSSSFAQWQTFWARIITCFNTYSLIVAAGARLCGSSMTAMGASIVFSTFVALFAILIILKVFIHLYYTAKSRLEVNIRFLVVSWTNSLKNDSYQNPVDHSIRHTVCTVQSFPHSKVFTDWPHRIAFVCDLIYFYTCSVFRFTDYVV